MKHNINELYELRNATRKTLMTEDYCKAQGYTIGTDRQVRRACQLNGEVYAMPCLFRTHNDKPVKVLTLEGVKLIYLYGEKAYFDTEEERTAYREELKKI